MGEVERHRYCVMQSRCLFLLKAMSEYEEFVKLFENADETKLKVMQGLIEEAFDCKAEIMELKQSILDLKQRCAKFTVIARRERLLLQKRANYTNMMARICKELCAVETDNFDDLGDYE